MSRPIQTYQIDFYKRIETEGFGLQSASLGAIQIDNAIAYNSANGTALASLTLNKPSRMWWIESITFSATYRYKCRLRIVDQTGYAFNSIPYNFTFPTQNQSILIGPNAITVPIKKFVGYGSAILLQQYGAPNGTLDTPADGSLTANVVGTITGWDITNDLHWNASKTILGWGDSVMYGQGCATNEGPYMMQLRNWYRKNGTDVRLVNMAYPGMTSYDLQLVQSQGLWQTETPDLIIYTMGVNDIQSDGGGFSLQRQGWLTAAIASAISYKQRNYPLAKMIICGMTPIFLSTGTQQTDAATCRTLTQAAVTLAADPTIFYLNLGNAWTFSDQSQYGDPGANSKHPNELGNTGVFNLLSTFITQNKIKI